MKRDDVTTIAIGGALCVVAMLGGRWFYWTWADGFKVALVFVLVMAVWRFGRDAHGPDS